MDTITLPHSYYVCDTVYLVHMIVDMLTTLIAHNDKIPVTATTLTRFHSRAPPAISISEYLKRIIKYASVEKACLVAILIYIDGVCERHRSFTISSLTVHRFIIAAVTVAAKAICDSYCTNAHYAKVGGISTAELNTLELEFLFLIQWHVASPAPLVQQYYANLVRQYPTFTLSPTLTPAPVGTRPDTTATVHPSCALGIPMYTTPPMLKQNTTITSSSLALSLHSIPSTPSLSPVRSIVPIGKPSSTAPTPVELTLA